MYDFWLFVHVIAAIVWVGGSVMLNVLGTRLLNANDPAAMSGFASQVEWLGTRVLMPASLILLLAGIIMTVDLWTFETLWIVIGLAGFLFSFINGAFFVGPLSGKTGKLLAERGRRMRRFGPGSRGSSSSAVSSLRCSSSWWGR
jgi:hypothetical protein